MILKTPLILLLIPILIGLIIFIKARQEKLAVRFSSLGLVNSLKSSWRIKFLSLPYFLRLVALILFLIALSGPQLVDEESVSHAEGIDIVLAIDASGSMAAEDFKLEQKRYNRLKILKNVVSKFIEERKNDRIGLIAFAGVAYTVCPLTTDTDWLIKNLERIQLGLISDGTAVGSAIASSLARLKTSDAKSKIIILLTDGMNNAGKMDPLSAAKASEALGIKIYTIGVGSKGYVPFPARDLFGRKVYQNQLIDLDEETLKEVAQITHGKYFRATDTESLRKIYKEIDLLEKTEIQEYGYKEYTELFEKFLVLGLIFLALEIILSNTLLLKVP